MNHIHELNASHSKKFASKPMESQELNMSSHGRVDKEEKQSQVASSKIPYSVMNPTIDPRAMVAWPSGLEDWTETYALQEATNASRAILETSAQEDAVKVMLNDTSSANNGTGNSTILQDEENDMLRTIEYIGGVLYFYYVPIIVGTGSLGNILSVFVFFRTKLRKLSSSFYLAALAVSDTCFLFGLFAQWLNFVDVHIYNREYFCQFFTFFSSLACFCSVWFVVAFTVERFIAVMYPLKRQTMCTVRRAKMVLLGLTLLGCLHCAPFWIYSTPVYSSKLEMTICDIKNEYKDYITLLNYWDTVVVFAVPFTTIAILNTFTGCTVWKFATVRRTLTMQKIKSHHIPLMHDITVTTPATAASTCAVAVNTTAATKTTIISDSLNLSGNEQGACSSTAITTYRLTSTPATTSSIKRQKSNHCGATSVNGGHEHSDLHVGHQHAHRHRNTILKQHHHHSHTSYHQHHHNHSSQQQHHQHSYSHPHHPGHHQSTRSTSGCRANPINGICTDNSRKSGRRNAGNSSQLKVTKMLLIVSTVFVCLNLPSCIMRMITYLETQSSHNEKTTVVLQYIFHLLFITNFGINFVLYCVSGQNFRNAVLSMFRRVSNTQRDVTTQITVSEYYRNSAGGCPGPSGLNSGMVITKATIATNVDGDGVESGSDDVLCSGSGCRSSSTRRRMMAQNNFNEVHELQNLN
ncbi:uncharacterized protein LOC106084961 [Stomoxys calcitrans]|uniref:G-protein coupled receptors family 1 profile domain-containing protein n=1 Tax=Stomoxys calcitrans TaxID=35570 RepID=A0A1I8NQD4_STOCA|nr:uncharacterized protein LOC106084961 [Stomoxys calcitrans]